MKKQVGGFGIKLFGSSECIMVVKFNKNVYYPGETATIGIECDNTKCKDSVKSFKIKLYRQLRHKESVSGHYETTDSCLQTVKHPGCARG